MRCTTVPDASFFFSFVCVFSTRTICSCTSWVCSPFSAVLFSPLPLCLTLRRQGDRCVRGPLGRGARCGGCLSYWTRDMVLRWYCMALWKRRQGWVWYGKAEGRKTLGRAGCEEGAGGVMPVWASRQFFHIFTGGMLCVGSGNLAWVEYQRGKILLRLFVCMVHWLGFVVECARHAIRGLRSATRGMCNQYSYSAHPCLHSNQSRSSYSSILVVEITLPVIFLHLLRIRGQVAWPSTSSPPSPSHQLYYFHKDRYLPGNVIHALIPRRFTSKSRIPRRRFCPVAKARGVRVSAWRKKTCRAKEPPRVFSNQYWVYKLHSFSLILNFLL